VIATTAPKIASLEREMEDVRARNKVSTVDYVTEGAGQGRRHVGSIRNL